MSELRFYRPNKSNNGAASRVQMSAKPRDKWVDILCFWEFAKQTGADSNGNATFAWSKETKDAAQCITVKMGELDIGEILAVLNGRVEIAGSTGKGLFHKNQTGNTVLNFSKAVKDGKHTGYYVKVSNKKNDAEEATVIQHVLSIAEGEILRVVLANSLLQMLDWQAKVYEK